MDIRYSGWLIEVNKLTGYVSKCIFRCRPGARSVLKTPPSGRDCGNFDDTLPGAPVPLTLVELVGGENSKFQCDQIRHLAAGGTPPFVVAHCQLGDHVLRCLSSSRLRGSAYLSAIV